METGGPVPALNPTRATPTGNDEETDVRTHPRREGRRVRRGDHCRRRDERGRIPGAYTLSTPFSGKATARIGP
ncbi:hypothetical protein ACR6C2_37350 [Streptomyces sp. INA 01156]